LLADARRGGRGQPIRRALPYPGRSNELSCGARPHGVPAVPAPPELAGELLGSGTSEELAGAVAPWLFASLVKTELEGEPKTAQSCREAHPGGGKRDDRDAEAE